MTDIGRTWHAISLPLQRSRSRGRLRAWVAEAAHTVREALRQPPRRPDPPNPRRDRFMEHAAMARELHRL